MKGILICTLLFLFLGQIVCQDTAADEVTDDFDEKYRNAFEDDPEEVLIHKDDLKEWIGQDPDQHKREDLHAVGMCWQSEMARCVNSCQNSTANIEILQEICASYCQADVTWTCTKLNLDYGGTEIFKFSGRWPFRRVLWFTEFGSVLFCTFSVLMHMFWLFEYITKTDSVKGFSASGES